MDFGSFWEGLMVFRRIGERVRGVCAFGMGFVWGEKGSR